MRERMRSAAAVTFAAWVAFCFAAAVVGRTTNDPRFDEAAFAHPQVRALRSLAIAALGGSVLAVGCAAVPLAVAAMWQACRRRDRGAFALFAAPVAGLAIFVSYTALLAQRPDQPVHSVANVLMTVSWFALGVIVAEVAGVGAVTALMRRTEFPRALLRCAGWAAVAAAAAMSVALVAGAAYGLTIWVVKPSLFLASDGVLQTPLPLTWTGSLLVAGTASAAATRAATRGVRARRTAA